MAIIRNFKQQRQNNKAINAFLDIAVGTALGATQSSMKKIAERGIDTLVKHVARFSDYSGIMINSYQAAIIRHGNFKTKGIDGQLSLFKGDKVELMTSYGKNGTMSIIPENKYIRNQRNPNSKGSIFLTEREMSEKKKHPNGYGRDLTVMRTYKSGISLGMETVFSNPTPYALDVMKNNLGSWVMPLGGAAQILPKGVAISITAAEIRTATMKAGAKMRK